MKLKNNEIKDILIKQNYLSIDDFKEADKICAKTGQSIDECLLSLGIISKDILGQAMAEWYKVPYADLNSNQPRKDQVLKIEENIAKKYRVVLFSEDDKNFVITTDNPKQKSLLDVLSKIFPEKKIIIAYSVSSDIEDSFVYYRKALNTKFSEIIKDSKKFAPEIIDAIIDDAITYRASDVHFEPQGNKETLIRFRVDGMLQEAGVVANEYYENILNRIKVQSHLRIDEHNSAQDGAVRITTKSGRTIDLRISIIPILDGEKIVIRLLSEYIRNFSLSELGFSPKEELSMNKSISRPFGMILSVGPTGSGKTTTLYTIIKKLNRPEINITTIEDPVEYKIPGINQIQVNSGAGLTFAKGLRSIVRQDPNVVLVGEIRDKETVEISINAALTGHLVLSTFHANDAATAIPRLMDMGAEPFLLASTLEKIIAQRLVRKLCESCRYSETVTKKYFESVSREIIPYLPKDNKYTIFKSKGCETCNNTGYKGRVGLFEIINMTQEMKDLMLHNPSSKTIWDLAKKQGAKTLFEDGLEKVKHGITSLEEVMRVAPPQN
ncbi:MAG TPA: GspE/PulE family protein [bacterium]|nr:GspE/PulE family protein [bacterium]